MTYRLIGNGVLAVTHIASGSWLGYGRTDIRGGRPYMRAIAGSQMRHGELEAAQEPWSVAAEVGSTIAWPFPARAPGFDRVARAEHLAAGVISR